MPIYALHTREMAHTLAFPTSHGCPLCFPRLFFSTTITPDDYCFYFTSALHSGAASNSALALVRKTRRLLVSHASPVAPDASAELKTGSRPRTSFALPSGKTQPQTATQGTMVISLTTRKA